MSVLCTAVLIACGSFVAAPIASGFTTDAAKKALTSDGSYADTVAAVGAARSKGEDGWVLTVGEP